LKPCHTPKKTGGVTVYGYRHYTPKTGQFLGRDPIGENGGMNLYGFVGNDGGNGFDYLGLATLTVNVDRYARTKEAIYSIVTLSSDDSDINKCCCLPKSYQGLERGTAETVNLLDEGTLNSSFTPENSPPFGPKNPKGKYLTSIKGRVAKHGATHGIKIPVKPLSMHQLDYNKAINNEFRLGDVGDNIHAGRSRHHSSGCVILGYCRPGVEPDSYQGSLEMDLEFKAAVACAQRKSKDKSNKLSIKTVVSKLPPITIGPIIPTALVVTPCDQ
jgi:RHS repeat-associated protein